MPAISIKKDLQNDKSLKNVSGNQKENILANDELSSAWPSLAASTSAFTPGTLPISGNSHSNGIGGGGKKDWKKIDIPIRHANDHPSFSKKKGSSKSKRDHSFHSSNYKDSSSSQFHSRFPSQSSSTSNPTQQFRKRGLPRRMGRTRSQMSYQEQPEMDQVQILIQWIIYQL